jgi:hypothetical protein
MMNRKTLQENLPLWVIAGLTNGGYFWTSILGAGILSAKPSFNSPLFLKNQLTDISGYRLGNL